MSNTVLKTIHVAVRDLGLDDETRRDLQLRVTGKASLREMTDAERLAVLDELKAYGFKPAPKPGARGHRRPATRGDVRFIHVLWGKLAKAGAIDAPGSAGLNAFIRSRFEKAWGAVPIDVDSMRDWKQIATVIEALKAMCHRAGIELGGARPGRTTDVPTANDPPTVPGSTPRSEGNPIKHIDQDAGARQIGGAGQVRSMDVHAENDPTAPGSTPQDKLPPRD